MFRRLGELYHRKKNPKPETHTFHRKNARFTENHPFYVGSGKNNDAPLGKKTETQHTFHGKPPILYWIWENWEKTETHPSFVFS